MGATILIIFGYALGALPFTVALSVAVGIDVLTETDLYAALRRQAGWPHAAASVLVDTAKGMFPVLIGFGFSFSPWVVSGAAIATVIGQMWPPLRGHGAKGNSTAIGALTVLALVYEVYLVLLCLPFFVTGIAFRLLLLASPPEERDPDSLLAVALPFMMLIGFVVAPVLSWLAGGHSGMTVGVALILCVIVAKRLTAGLRTDLDVGVGAGRVLLRRLLFDQSLAGRDV